MNKKTNFSQFLTIEFGTEIHYQDVGQGQPLILIPGWTFSSEVFTHQIDYFSKNYRVIAIDPRSQGRSSKVMQGNDYRTHAKDLATLISHLNLTDVILVGWSTGNLTIWNYAEYIGVDNIAAFVAIDMSPKALSFNSDDWTEGSLDEAAEVYTTMLNTPEEQREFIKYYAREIMLQKPCDEAVNFIADLSLRTPTYIAKTLYADAMFSNTSKGAAIATASTPHLIFIAEHWAKVAVPYMNKHYPQMKTHVLGGHIMFYELHEQFNQLLSAFLSAIKK